MDEAIEAAARELHRQHSSTLKPLAPMQSWSLVEDDRKKDYRLAATRIIDAFENVVARQTSL